MRTPSDWLYCGNLYQLSDLCVLGGCPNGPTSMTKEQLHQARLQFTKDGFAVRFVDMSEAQLEVIRKSLPPAKSTT